MERSHLRHLSRQFSSGWWFFFCLAIFRSFSCQDLFCKGTKCLISNLDLICLSPESFIILNILNIILDIYLGEASMNWWSLKVGGVPTQRIQIWTGFLPGLGPEWTESLGFWPPTIACLKGHQPRHSSLVEKKTPATWRIAGTTRWKFWQASPQKR